MGGFEEVAKAAAMRDIIERVASRVIARERPDVKVGKVYSIDVLNQEAKVVLPGDTDINNLVTVRFAKNMQPTSLMITNFATAGMAAPGDIVRIAGKPGSYWICDFQFGTPLSTYVPTAAALQAIKPYFHGYVPGNTQLGNNQTAPYTVKEDNMAGYNSTTRQYKIIVPGLYQLFVAAKQQNTQVVIGQYVQKNGAALAVSPNAAPQSYNGPAMPFEDRFAAGDLIDVRYDLQFSTQNDAPGENTYLIIQYA